jgi:hypothetical protein
VSTSAIADQAEGGAGVPEWLFHGWSEDAVAAAKAAGMLAVAVVGLRLSPRRTLAQWTAIDVAAAVALGAIIGRTAPEPSSPISGRSIRRRRRASAR